MKIYLLSFFVLLSVTLKAQEETVVLKTPTGHVYGTLKMPEIKTNIPVVLFIAGSGPTDRNGNQPRMQNNSLKMLSEGLCKNGIAVLSYDKRGIAESAVKDWDESDMTLDVYIDDASQWVDFLAKDKRFSNIIIAGHSEGSLIGMIASGKNKRVNKFISIAGPGLPLDEILKEQMEKQPQMVKDLVNPIIDKLKAGQKVDSISPLLISLFRPSVQPFLISCFQYDPRTEISKLTIPVLIIQGTTDIQVSVNHADLLVEANPKAKKRIIENMNHILKDCTSTEQMIQLGTYTNPDIPLNKEIVPDMVQFIQN